MADRHLVQTLTMRMDVYAVKNATGDYTLEVETDLSDSMTFELPLDVRGVVRDEMQEALRNGERAFYDG